MCSNFCGVRREANFDLVYLVYIGFLLEIQNSMSFVH